MLTCCNTARGRVACGLGGVLIAVLALACLWAFSPSVTAGDDPLLPPPLPKESGKTGKKATCPDPGLPLVPPMPPMPPPPKADVTAEPPRISGSSPPPSAPPPSPLAEIGSSKAPSPLPVADTAPPPPTGPISPVSGVAPVPPPPTQAQPPVDAQDVKQLVAQLTEIRADRAKLDEKERQTIQTIKRKYQDQKRALEQLDRELRQLGINCDETAPDKAPVRPTEPLETH